MARTLVLCTARRLDIKLECSMLSGVSCVSSTKALCHSIGWMVYELLVDMWAWRHSNSHLQHGAWKMYIKSESIEGFEKELWNSFG